MKARKHFRAPQSEYSMSLLRGDIDENCTPLTECHANNIS